MLCCPLTTCRYALSGLEIHVKKKKMVVHWIVQSLCVLLSFVSWIIAMEHLTDVFPVL